MNILQTRFFLLNTAVLFEMVSALMILVLCVTKCLTVIQVNVVVGASEKGTVTDY